MDSANPLEAVTLAALRENLTKDPKLVELKRRLALARVRREVSKFRAEEIALHESMPRSVAKVMEGKAILALEALLQAEGYDDLGAITFLKEGVPLVGVSECPPCFDCKLVPAALTEAELFQTAQVRREALLSKSEPIDAEEARVLAEASQEEVSLGFLEGPFYSRDEVSSRLETESWTVIRRFVIFQGAEGKARPIDNCLEAQLNSGYTSSIHLRLQDGDYLAAMALFVAREITGGRAHPEAQEWRGKCLDLSKAYKQLAVLPAHRPLAVIAVRQEDGRDALYLSNSLLFGSTAAVYAFNRVSRCLWFLINRLLWIPSGVYFDDYPLLCPAATAESADSVVSDFLDCLGWRHAKTGVKGRAFAPSRAAQGEVSLANKQGRIERIVGQLKEVGSKGEISRQLAQVLQGLLQCASGFYAGRALKHASHVLSRIVGGLHFSPPDLRDFCHHTIRLLQDETPRVLKCFMTTDVLHLWTDGSWESGVAGVGLAAHDCFSGSGWVLEGRVPSGIGGDQLICVIEMFAILASMMELSSILESRGVVWWVDNNATRGLVIKGASRSWAMHTLARIFSQLDQKHPSMWWVSRVPSFSNPGDAPSRGHGIEVVTMVGASEVQPFTRLEELAKRILELKRA
ncbi:unnamed protein product [Symbiodinium natans]|uniref:Reverse transcriptase domain-containing protein n=1 Tax=Symbiodinium natans TaxID=878477 RepID=A0A812GRB5_9DINO|nr:unnamed protein product [Symbiodinium natans]